DADMSLKQGSGTGKVHFGGLDDVSLYGTPVEPAPPAPDAKQ
ncbi:jg25290, partial [Pararge aegeria aegeria]